MQRHGRPGGQGGNHVESSELPEHRLTVEEKLAGIAKCSLNPCPPGGLASAILTGYLLMSRETLAGLKARFPDEPERLRYLQETLGQERLEAEVDAINFWLTDIKREELRLSVTDLLKIIAGDRNPSEKVD